ncbi:hypothetical protein PIB30_015211 [Stylosanthes scabra]|uniref:Uncharacterized protein n=1 Tax=Stylosanthes scabra TaxID=79078 RepID=A0ABU6W856_9FABA|nr:hypothetical protein [Stylosanthes scabra]
MASDPSLFKHPTKKKKGNGSAKLKQIKLDVRREQWLSRVTKGCNVDSNRSIDYCPSSKHVANEENGSPNKENRKRGEDTEGSCIQLRNDSTTSIDRESRNGFSWWSSTSSSSISTSFSGSEEEPDDNNGCLDDWEAVADALNTDDHRPSTTSEPASMDSKHQAWKPDDAFRPVCLPNLSKQHSSTVNSRWHCNKKPAKLGMANNHFTTFAMPYML